MNRDEVHAGTDVVGSECFDKLSPVNCQAVQLQANDVQMVDMIAIGMDHRCFNVSQAGQAFFV